MILFNTLGYNIILDLDMPEKTVIIVAHGSKKNEANLEVIEYVKELNNYSKNVLIVFEYAFLEFTEPSIVSQIDKAAKTGSTQIILFPFFAVKGKHVSIDLPRIIDECKIKYPKINFRLTKYLGEIPGVKKLISNYLGTC